MSVSRVKSNRRAGRPPRIYLLLSRAATVTTNPMLGTSNRTQQAMLAASPFCTAPKSLIRETLEVAGLVGGSLLHRAVDLLSSRGTVVPNRSHSDSSSESTLFPNTQCPRFPGLGLRRSIFPSCARGCCCSKCPESEQSSTGQKKALQKVEGALGQGLDTLLT